MELCHLCSADSVRKNAEDLRASLEQVVIPVFCKTHNSAGVDGKQKLDKVFFSIIYVVFSVGL